MTPGGLCEAKMNLIMIVNDAYGKIEKTVISKKLQLYIANLPNEKDNEWKQELVRVMEREISVNKIMLKNC